MYPETTGSGGNGIAGLGQVGSSLNAAVPKSATERETEQLHKAVSILNQLVCVIQTRLKLVLREDFPIDPNGRDDESIPALANAVRQSRYVTEATIDIANNILGRLDL